MTTNKLADGIVQTTSNGSAQPEIEIVDVTPALAREWMRRNVHNRNLRDRKVQQYCNDMARGDWRWTGESIKFDHNGNLIDGQHRLTALVLADRTLKMLVVRGLAPEAQDELDQGIPRLFHDILQLRGEQNTTVLAATIRRVSLWEAGHRRRVNGTVGASTPQLLRALEEHPELRDISHRAVALSKGCELPGSIVGLALFVFSRLDEVDATFFFDRLSDGQNLRKGDPIYELRRTLSGTKDMRGQRSQTFLLAITIKAWNAFREGRSATENPVALYRYRPGGANPESFPEPI